MGLEPVTQSPFVQVTVAGLKRSLAKPKVRKEPVTVDMQTVLVYSLGVSLSLSDIRLAASCLLAFAAFFIVMKFPSSGVVTSLSLALACQCTYWAVKLTSTGREIQFWWLAQVP